MSKTLAQLQEEYVKFEIDSKNQLNSLAKEIEVARKKEQAEALSKIKAIMSEYGISSGDLGSAKGPKRRKATGPAAPKYRGPNGETWSGRGRQPKWLGTDREKFLIKD